MTELAYQWWRIRAPGGDLTNELTARLAHLFALSANSRVEVREPEVWSGASHWPASEYHDGRALTAAEATSLVGRMLASTEFWCRLVTNVAEVHVAEEMVYVGTLGPRVDELELGEPVESSPYAIDRQNFSYYPPANEEFWHNVCRDADSSAGEMLILQQWAAGFGGERWYHVASVGDLEAARRDVIPRALYAAFRDPRLVRRARCPEEPISTILGEESLLANVRFFRDLSVSPLIAEHAANDQELASIWRSLGDRGSVFLWDDGAVVEYAAQPDVDGRVRVAASFQ